MQLDLESLISQVLEQEGGYVDDPDDQGGPTNFGITLAKLSDWLGVPATMDDLKALTSVKAREIYRWMFVHEMGLAAGGAASSPKLQGLLFDCLVHHGQGNAIKFLQEAVKVKVDGFLGPKTRAALAAAEPGDLYRGVLAARIRKFGRIITNDPTQSKFAAGWNDRAADFVEETP